MAFFVFEVGKVWHVIVASVGLCCILLLAPWLLGVLFRGLGREPPSRARRVWACLASALAAGGAELLVGMLLLLALARSEEHWLTLLLVLGVTTLVAAFVALSAFRSVVGRRGQFRFRAIVPAGIVVMLSVFALSATVLDFVRGVRQWSKRSMEASNLRIIGTALAMYHDSHRMYPDDLRRLVDDGYFTPVLLLAMYGQRRDQIPDPLTKPYDGPCDIDYIPLPPDAPDDLVVAWVSPVFHGNEGGYLLLKSGDVSWAEPAALFEAVANTYRWLFSRVPATIPGNRS